MLTGKDSSPDDQFSYRRMSQFASRKLRIVLVTGIGVSVAAFGSWVVMRTFRRLPEPPAAQLVLSLVAEVHGAFQDPFGYGWRLDVNPTGIARLEIRNRFPYRVEYFQVPPEQWGKFKQTVEFSRFHSLQSEYGEFSFDSPSRVLELSSGSRTKRIDIGYFPRDGRISAEEAELLNLWRVIQRWVRNPECFDFGVIDPPRS